MDTPGRVPDESARKRHPVDRQSRQEQAPPDYDQITMFGQIARLQRLAGNTAVNAVLRQLALQRAQQSPMRSDATATSDLMAPASPPSPASLQRHDSSAHEHAEEDDAPENLQAQADVGLEGGPLSAEVSGRINARRGGGAPLDDTTRGTMESGFGTSFVGVRVHTDGEADALNRTVSARAFTTGSDIFFSAGTYQPGTGRGDHLLAHELTHVVQQQGSTSSGPLVVGPSDDRYEQQADAVGGAVAAGIDRSANGKVMPAPLTTTDSSPADGADSHVGRAAMGAWMGAGPLFSRSALLSRVHIDGQLDEKLLQPYDDKDKATKTLQPHSYSQDVHYDMTRDPDKINVAVKIKFVKPDETAIPASDTARRAFATTTCSHLVSSWNGKFVLVSHPLGTSSPAPAAAAPGTPAPAPTPAPTPAPAPGVSPPSAPPPAEIRLPLQFTATPVFDAGGGTPMPVVHVHGQDDAATGEPGKRIDSGNWFMNTGSYGASPDMIYAHEYGHLLGIPDEYSQSNAQMHALLHHVSPNASTQAQDKMLDQAGIAAMVLAAIRPQMEHSLHAISRQVSTSMRAQHAAMEAQLAAGLRQGMLSAAAPLQLSMAAQLIGGGHVTMVTSLPDAFSTAIGGVNWTAQAARAVASQLSPAHVEDIIQGAYGQAMLNASHVSVPVQGGAPMSVTIGTSDAVDAAASGHSPLAHAAQAIATGSIGQPPTPRRGGRMPPITASPTLLSQIEAVAGRWGGIANLMGSQISQLPVRIVEDYGTSGYDASAVENVARLQRGTHRVVESLASLAAQQAVNDFVTAEIGPLINNQVGQIVSLVKAELDSHTTATGTGTNASPAATPDPQILAAVQQMTTAMQQMQQSGSATPPRPGAAGAPAAPASGAQNVSYTVDSLMGDNTESAAMRPDYMNGLAAQFNGALRKADTEEEFKPRNA